MLYCSLYGEIEFPNGIENLRCVFLLDPRFGGGIGNFYGELPVFKRRQSRARNPILVGALT